MNEIFCPYLDKFVIVYLDDILVFSKTVRKHKEHLKIVFGVLRQHVLFVNKKKSEFFQPRLEYLGHIVSGDGISVDPKKIEVIVN